MKNINISEIEGISFLNSAELVQIEGGCWLEDAIEAVGRWLGEKIFPNGY